MCDSSFNDVSHFLHGFFEGARAHSLRSFGTGAVAFFQVCPILHQLLEALLHGLELCDNAFADRYLEIALAFAGKLIFNLLVALAGGARVNPHQVIDTVFPLGIAHLCLAVGHGTLEFFHDDVRLIENTNK